jgi:hypothetical protein
MVCESHHLWWQWVRRFGQVLSPCCQAFMFHLSKSAARCVRRRKEDWKNLEESSRGLLYSLILGWRSWKWHRQEGGLKISKVHVAWLANKHEWKRITFGRFESRRQTYFNSKRTENQDEMRVSQMIRWSAYRCWKRRHEANPVNR